VPGRAAALCQLESGALQPEEGSACGDRSMAKASSEDRRGHSPQTPPGETPQGGKQHTGKPTRQQVYSSPSSLASCSTPASAIKTSALVAGRRCCAAKRAFHARSSPALSWM